MSLHKPFIVRRTLSQERFEVLWQKRLEGAATLKDLAEMDEIINRDPLVMQFVLREMENEVTPLTGGDQQNNHPATPSCRHTFFDRVKSFFKYLATCAAPWLRLTIS